MDKIYRVASVIILIVYARLVVVPFLNNLYRRWRMKHSSFAQQLKLFHDLGFVFNEGSSQDDLISMWGKDAFGKEPYSLMYISLGSTIEKEPWTPITNNAWHFDTEAIEDHGAYVSILEELQRISRGELIFKNISDVVDHETEKASVSFEINGEKYKYDLKWNNDWVDPAIFSRVVDLTKKYNTKGRFTYFDTGGQDCVIGYATPPELKEIRSKTGLNILWLK